MGWTQQIEYQEVEVALPPPVRKQIWNGTEFVTVTLYRRLGHLKQEHRDWLANNFGQPNQYLAGRYWDTSRTGLFTVMDEKVYSWFCLKWGKQ
jgi:hypothetical protein